MAGPKILLLDIETAPNKAYVWGTNKQFVAYNQIVEPGYTLCWAAKWLNSKEIFFGSINSGTAKKMVKDIYKLINEADAVVHYNGKKFDMPTLNREFIQHGLTPPAPYKQIDLYHVVRQNFKYPSNKLDYVSQALGLGAKVAHKGVELWADCMNKDQKAWKIMEKYNKEDVKLLERLYYILLPWISNHPNYALYVDPERPMCPNCGSYKLQSRGTYPTTTMVYRRFQCKDCGKWCKARKNCTTENQKENVMGPAR